MNMHIQQKNYHPVWAEINLEAIRHNFTVARNFTPAGVKTMAVLKANAYGHGDVQVAKSLESYGADYFGVARLSEALRLRKNGIRIPILVFGYTPVESVESLVAYDIAQTVYSRSYAISLSEKLKEIGGTITSHIKVDTGMGRLGIFPEHVTTSESNPQKLIHRLCTGIEDILGLQCLKIEGIFTHLASSDSIDKSTAHKQLALFGKVNEELKRRGREIPLRHAANSAAVLSLPESHLDMIRPGIMLYGCNPLENQPPPPVQLKEAMRIETRVSQIKRVPAGFTISYGNTYSTPKSTIIATLPLGYADGYDRRFSSSGKVLIRGQYAPIVGRVCMDQLMVDVGHIDSVGPDDIATIIGTQGEASITADKIAEQLQTISYEVLSTVMDRVPRLYIG